MTTKQIIKSLRACGRGCRDDCACIQKEVWLRLKAYEDTGLTPEQCAEYGKADREGRYIVLRDAGQDGVKRLRELAEADKEGRLVVMPCKVGDTVYCFKKVYDCSANRPAWRVEAKRISGIPDDYLLIDGSIQLPLERFNKTVFLTREEAERALQEMEGKELKKYQKADKDGRLVAPSCNKVLTNADRMRAATNQQLAKQLYDNQKALCRMLYKKLGFEDELNFSEDYSDILAWLNAPSKEAEKALEAMKNE